MPLKSSQVSWSGRREQLLNDGSEAIKDAMLLTGAFNPGTSPPDEPASDRWLGRRQDAISPFRSGTPAATTLRTHAADSRAQQPDTQPSSHNQALPPFGSTQHQSFTGSEASAPLEASEGQPAASDPSSSAAVTAQLLLALSSGDVSGAQLQHITNTASPARFRLPSQGQDSSQEDQEQLSPRRLPPISPPAAKRRCTGPKELSQALPASAKDSHREPANARTQVQQGAIPVAHPVASKHSHSVEGVGACGQGFRAYVSPQAQHAASQKEVPASAAGPTSQLLHQSSSPSRMSTLTHAALAASASGNRSGTTKSNTAHAQPTTSTEMTMQPSMSVPSGLAPVNSSQLAGMDSDNSVGSLDSGGDNAAAATAGVAQKSRTDNSILPEAPPLQTELPHSMAYKPAWQRHMGAANAGMMPFWNASKDQARENQEAEMAAFCEAYTRAANAAREGGSEEMKETPGASSMQHQHMLYAMRSHAMYQQQMMMQHFMMGMHSGGRAAGDQPAWPLRPGWPMPNAAMPHSAYPAYAPTPFMPGAMHGSSSAFRSAAMHWSAAGSASQCTSGMSPPASSLPRATSTGTEPSQAPSLSLGPREGLGRQLLRDQALRKYKLKRQNLTYSKKIRYESRKQLAKSRPRVKGQFVRMDSADVADLEEGADDLPEAGADDSQQWVDSLQLAADNATEAVRQLADGAHRAAPKSAAHKAALASQAGLLRQCLTLFEDSLAQRLPCE